MNSDGAASIGDNRRLAFDLEDDQRAILDQADRFARNELYALSERMDADEWWPEDAFPKIGENGLFGVTVPEEYGGAGLDLMAGRPGAAGPGPLEPCAGAGLGGAREFVHQQPLSQRQRGAAPQIFAGPVLRPDDRRAWPDRARRRLRRAGLDAHDRAARRRPLRAERQQDVHHQRADRRRAAGLRQDRQGKGRARHLGLHRREGFSGLQGRAEAGEDGLSRQPDRRAGVRGMPRAGREPASATRTAASPS